MAFSEIGVRLVRLNLMTHHLVTGAPVDLSMFFAVRLRRDVRRFGRHTLRARSRQGERGDRQGDESDDNGPQIAHGGDDYVVAPLKVK